MPRRLGNDEDQRNARRMDMLFIGLVVLFVVVILVMVYLRMKQVI